MKNALIFISLFISLYANAALEPVNLEFTSDNASVETVSLPKKINLEKLEIINELFSAKLKFVGKVDGRKLELIVPLEKMKEDNNYFQVRAVILSEFLVEEVCGESWHRELILSFQISRAGDWTSNYSFKGYHAHTLDNCHSPEQVQVFNYLQED